MKEVCREKSEIVIRGTRQRKDGRYETRVQLGYGTDGKEIVKSFYSETSKGSKIKASKFIEEYNLAHGDISEIPFAKAMERWLVEIKRSSIKSTSYDRLEEIFKYQIQPYALSINKPVKEIKPIDLQKILNSNSEKYSRSTMKKVKSRLNQFFEYAHYSRSISFNPAAILTLKSDDETTVLHNPFEEDKSKILSCEQIERLKEAAEKENLKTEYQNLFFIFMLNSALRAGEALALEYSDIDFENKTVNIHKNYVNHKKRDEDGTSIGRINEITFTKTRKSNCILPLNQTATEILIRMKSYEPEGYTGPIIHNKRFERIGPRSFAKRFYALLNQAEIEKCGLHTLRRTCGSILYETSGHNQYFVSAYLRHTSVASTNSYIHLINIARENITEI